MAESGAIRAGKAYIELGLDPSRLTKGLKKAGDQLRSMGKIIAGIGAGFTAASAAIVAPLTAMATAAADSGAALELASMKTGATVESLSALKYAAEQTGVGFDTLVKGVGLMEKFLADAANGQIPENIQELNHLGLALSDVAGRSPDKQMGIIADALGRLRDPAQRSASAMAIFGRTGRELIPMLIGGSKSLDEYIARAKALGIVMGSDEAKAGYDFSRAMKDIGSELERLKQVIGGALLPMLARQIDLVIRAGSIAIQFVRDHQAMVVKIFAVGSALSIVGGILVATGVLVASLGVIIGGVGSVIATFVGIVGTIGAALSTIMFSGIGVVIAGLTALGAYFAYASEAGQHTVQFLSDAFNSLRDDVTAAWKGIADALSAGDFRTAAAIAWTGVKIEFEKGISYVKGIWRSFSDGFQDYFSIALYGVKRVFEDIVAYMSKKILEFANTSAGVLNVILKATGQKEFPVLSDEEERDAEKQADKIHALQLKNINQEELDSKTHRDKSSSDAAAKAAAIIAGLNAEMKKLLATAHTEARPGGVLAWLKDHLPNIPNAPAPPAVPTPGDMDAVLGKTVSHGTFNPYAAGALGANRTADRIAKATERSAIDIKRMADKIVSDTGPVFA